MFSISNLAKQLL